MKHKIIASGTVALLLAGGALVLTAAPAQAVDSFGICVPSDETTTTIEHPAIGEPTIVVPNPDYIPAVPEVPGVPAVGTPTIIVDNPDYVPAVPGTPGSPAIGDPTIEVDNPDYIPAVPGTDAVPAVGTPTIEVPNPDYVPAVPAIPAKPAVGEPTIVVDNPDYVAPTYTPGFWEHVPAKYTPPVGKPTIIVTKPNPDYVPAVAEVPEQSHTDFHAKRYVVDTPAQEAVYATQWKYVKHGGKGEVWVDNDSAKYVDSNGNPAEWGDWPIYERTQKTRQVEVSPAVPEQGHWEENHFHEHPGDGWTILSESKHVTQEYVPGSPAVGSETIDVEEANPDYVPPTYVPAHKVWVPPVYTPPVGKPTMVIDNPDYVPATDEIPGTDAIGEPTIVIENPGYVAEIPATPGTPAVGEPTIVVDNPAYVPAVPAVDEIPAVGEPTLEVANPEYVPAVPAIPGTDAVGTETIITLNPDYEPAWVETITVPAVECPVDPGEKPADFTLPSEWFIGVYDCDDTMVTETRVVDTYTYKLVDGQWVETFVKQDMETRERALTAEEIDALECEVPTEPKPEEPKAEEPGAPAPKPAARAAAAAPAAAAETEETLATTGGELSPWIAGAGLAALLAGAGLTLARRKN